MEMPSPRRLARPRMMTMFDDNAAPATPETTANVVTEPSMAPKTKSPMWVPSLCSSAAWMAFLVWAALVASVSFTLKACCALLTRPDAFLPPVSNTWSMRNEGRNSYKNLLKSEAPQLLLLIMFSTSMSKVRHRLKVGEQPEFINVRKQELMPPFPSAPRSPRIGYFRHSRRHTWWWCILSGRR